MKEAQKEEQRKRQNEPKKRKSFLKTFSLRKYLSFIFFLLWLFLSAKLFAEIVKGFRHEISLRGLCSLPLCFCELFARAYEHV